MSVRYSEDCVTVDCSQGEGGGQVLRAALALSMATGRPFRIEKIRAGRPKPGLKRQHLTCVRAAGELCGAEIQGAEMGSGALTFTPGPLKPGDYHFDIGTGGSCTLVLQALIPPLLAAGAPSRRCMNSWPKLFFPGWKSSGRALRPKWNASATCRPAAAG